jgi:large subunit ribosomal protein L31
MGSITFLDITLIFAYHTTTMKTEIHPKYFKDAKVICACGNTFTTGSTKPEIRVEICAKCHPFYTGEEKFIDTAGRVEKFKTRTAKKAAPKAKKVRLKKN